MPARKKHLLVDGFLQKEDYATKKKYYGTPIPQRARAEHGQFLLDQYLASINEVNFRREGSTTSITEDVGIYLELTAFEGCELPLKSLDNSDFRLQTLTEFEGRQIAVIFVPDSRRNKLQKKISSYLSEDTARGKPKNSDLVNSIKSIRLANLESFWTDNRGLFPENRDESVWWELWLSKSHEQNTSEIVRSLSQRLGLQVGVSVTEFFNVDVALVRATVNQLEASIELISCLSELRLAKETPSFFMDLTPYEQADWISNISSRINFTETSNNVVASILDHGVNYNHPLLSLITTSSDSTTWNPAWPKFDTNVFGVEKHHGSMQAGLIVFGNMVDVASSTGPFNVNYRIESGRILPPRGQNQPELYGAITKDTALKLEITHPERKRVYSMAVTAENNSLSGQPTSWSSTIDNFIFGAGDGVRRIFVVSAGNNRSIQPDASVWDQACLTQIEDPAQSWNSITVGAYTELIDNDDLTYEGWTALSEKGDLAPGTSTSVNWGWHKHAPFKPDVVAEGGNRLLSPDSAEVNWSESLSLLTTSGNEAGALFATTRDTSAATALVTGIAATLISENPSFLPETIRGLIIHSAEWNEKMLERKEFLHRSHNQKKVKQLMLRSFGYGVPNVEKARYSASNLLTLIAQNSIQPFVRLEGKTDDAKFNKIHLYNLPWPQEVLQSLPPEMEVKLKVTLSYFVEANPSRRGFRDRFSYQSHGLRFDIKKPTQSLSNFKAVINQLSVTDDYDGPEGDSEGWLLGSQIRTRGSVHSDSWTGSAADLANMDAIAVYPVGGWWKSKISEGKWNESVPYSLIVSIEVPDQSVDIYSVIESVVEANVNIDIEV